METLPFLCDLQEHTHIVLASASPRRSEILNRLNIQFQVIPSTFSEDLDHGKFPQAEDYVYETARLKGTEVGNRLLNDPSLLQFNGRDKEILIISADTIVVCDNRIFEKPKDPEHAYEMLRQLSGRSHKVITAVCFNLLNAKNKEKASEYASASFTTSTLVFMNDFDKEVIDWYINTGEPFDKAGGYGYQSLGMALVKKIDGCYYNVIGFPLNDFLQALKRFLQ